MNPKCKDSIEQPLLSVITATRNLIATGRSDSMRRCIESIAQISVPHEHIICDGLSDDGTQDLLRELTNGRPEVRICSERDSGIYEAFNKGVCAARGEWIYFIGSDDFVFDPVAMVDVIRDVAESDAGFAISPVRHSDESCYFASPRDFGNILIIKPYCHQGVLMRKRVIEELGMFDESYRIAADFKLCLQAHLSNVKHLALWTRYAEFSVAGGISNVDRSEYLERVRVSASVLRLREDETRFLRKRELLPLRIIVRCFFHRNAVVRYGAYHALKRRIACAIGLLHPTGG